MQIETEVKYLINKLPANLSKPHLIEQIYFDKTTIEEKLKTIFNLQTLNNITTTRVRKITYDNKITHVLTLKSKGLISRQEYEKEISKEDYDLILKQPLKSIIIKNRYYIKYGHLTFEFDEYLNLGKNLKTVEIETNNLKEDQALIEKTLTNFFQISWKDITLDPSYKNSNLTQKFGYKK